MKYFCAVVIFVLFLPHTIYAQVHIDAETINAGESIYITEWKYHPGDDPSWADPDYDDSSWETVDSFLSKDNLPSSGWDGIGWFRIRVTMDDAL